jgi:large subunit ribosomal protein L17
VRDKGVVHRLFTEIAPDMAEPPGGYTRITKIGTARATTPPWPSSSWSASRCRQEGHRREAEAATRRSAKDAAVATEAPAAETTVDDNAEAASLVNADTESAVADETVADDAAATSGEGEVRRQDRRLSDVVRPAFVSLQP